MTEEEKPGESLLRTTEKLLDLIHKIFEVTDVRLTELENQVELLEKKKGNYP